MAQDQVAGPTWAPMQRRLKSLDVFRGAAIASMIVVNSLGSPEDSYLELRHSPWHGWTFADTIFPGFLFIVGVSLTLSTAARMERGADRASLAAHAVRRALLIFAAGVLIDWLIFPARHFPYFAFKDHPQLSGALQKIAVGYLVSFFIFLWGGWRGVWAGVVGISVLYAGLLYLYPVPGCGRGVLTPECSFPSFVNARLMDGYTSGAVYDPDGLGTALPTVASVMFGVLAGGALRAWHDHRRRIQWLLGGGLVLIVAGTILSPWVPLNKQLWTPSYFVLMAGLSSLAFAATYWVVDARHAGVWVRPFEILGLNAIACYLASRLIDHVLRVHIRGFSIPDALNNLASPAVASLLFAFVTLGVVYLGAWFAYRRRWFLRF